MQKNDLIVLQTRGRKYRYQVTDTAVVEPEHRDRAERGPDLVERRLAPADDDVAGLRPLARQLREAVDVPEDPELRRGVSRRRERQEHEGRRKSLHW